MSEQHKLDRDYHREGWLAPAPTPEEVRARPEARRK